MNRQIIIIAMSLVVITLALAGCNRQKAESPIEFDMPRNVLMLDPEFTMPKMQKDEGYTESPPVSDVSTDEVIVSTSAVTEETAEKEKEHVQTEAPETTSNAEDSSEVTTTPAVTTATEPTTTPQITIEATTSTTPTTTTKVTTTSETTTKATTTTPESESESYEIETVTEFYEPMGVEEMAQRFLELLNEERAKAGVPTLVTGPILQEMAQVRANELPILIGHRRPNGLGYSTILTEYKYGIPTGYYGTYFNGEQYEIYYRGNTGETVGMMDSTYPEVMIEGFRNSPGHWVVLMDPTLGAVGVAVVAVEDQTYGYLYYYEVLLTDKLYE